MVQSAGIVLAGGRSTRMGSAKAALEWHGSTLLRHVTGLMARAVSGPVVVVRAPGQQLPPLPGQVVITEDARPGRGPLQGLAAGLAAIDGKAAAVFVCATDSPLLHPAFVRAVVAALADFDVAVPRVAGVRQPLAAAYRTSVRATVEELLSQNALRVGRLLERLKINELDPEVLLRDPDLAAHDPSLESVVSLDEPDCYRAARARPAPLITVTANGRTLPLRAATLGAAAAAVGAPLRAPAVNGRRLDPDPQAPLACGDEVLL